MKTLAEYTTMRDAAGYRYSLAVAELKDSFADLAALDGVLANGNVGGGHQPTFACDRHALQIALKHPVYAPGDSVDLIEETRAKLGAYLAEHTV
jgi:hypothetical protein